MNVLKINYDKILEDAYNEHGDIIVAFDFDNTVYDFHKKGVNYTPIIKLLQECKKLGFKLICFTANQGERVTFIKLYIQEVLGLSDVRINHNIVPGHNNSLKPYANIYLDDKAGLNESYYRLNKLVIKIKKSQKK